MELILHYGMHKTGSSSIQESLSRHTLEGVEYINLGRANSSLWISKGFFRGYHLRPIFAVRKFTSQEIKRGRQEAREALVKGVQKVQAPIAILSAEDLCLLNEEEIRDLTDVLRPYANRIRAVGYLRSPKSYCESAFQQRIKRSPMPLSTSKVKIRHTAIIRAFDAVLGEENVEAWNFDRHSFPNQCVVQDFCQKLGLAFPKNKIIHVNESLSKQAVQMLYILWYYYPAVRPAWWRNIKYISSPVMRVQNINQAIAKGMRLVNRLAQYDGDKFHMHSSLYQQLIHFKEGEDLQWLRARTGFMQHENIEEHDAVGVRDEKEMLQLDERATAWLINEVGGHENPAVLCQNPRKIAHLLYRLREKI